MFRYIPAEKKEIYITHNDIKQVVLVWHHNRPDPEIRSSHYVVEYHELEKGDKYICEVRGATVSLWHVLWLKISRKIRRPTAEEYQAIKDYGFFEMIERMERRHISKGWLFADKPTLPFKT